MSKQFLQSTSYSFLALTSSLATNFIAFLLLIRILSEYEFGVWVLFCSVTALVEMARNGLIQNGLIKFMSANPTEENEIAKAALILSLLGSLGGAVALCLLSFPLSFLWNIPELPALCGCYVVYSMVTGVLKFMEFFQMGKNEFKGVFLSNLIFGGLFLAGISGLYFIGINDFLLALIGWQTLASMGAIGVVFFVQKDLFQPILKAKYQAHWTKELFHFGKYVFGTNFSSMLFNKTDILMLGFFLNPVAVAIYSLATRLSTYLEIPVNALAQVIYPKIAAVDYKNDQSEIIRLYEQSIGILLLIILPASAFVFFFAEPIVLLVSGGKYAEAVPILQIFLIAGLIKPWGRLFGITLDAIGKPKINFKMLVFSLVVNILLNLILIPQMGLMGAALATGFAIWMTIITGQIYLSNILSINHWRIFYNIFNPLKQFHRQMMN